jgi:branched-chain amino acid transport system substrate-binding protein
MTGSFHHYLTNKAFQSAYAVFYFSGQGAAQTAQKSAQKEEGTMIDRRGLMVIAGRGVTGLILAAGVVAAAQAEDGQLAQAGRLAGQEIRIGAIVPSSGPFAEWGKTNTIALKMLEDEVNAAGGVDGAKLKIVVYDDAARPAQAANLMRKLADDDKVLAVAGPLTSSAVEVAFPVANQAKMVATSQASSKPGVAALNRPWGFRNTIDEGVLAKATVPYLKKEYNVRSVAIVFDAKDAVSTSIAKNVMPAVMKAEGINVLNETNPLSFNTGDIDVSAQITSIKGLNPDAVVIGADYSQAITVIREMKRQGFVKPVIGGTPLISAAILKASPDLPIVAPATFYAGMEGASVQKFTSSLTPLLKKGAGLPAEIEPSMYDANIYEIVNIYLDAVRKEGVSAKPADLEADREKVMKHLTSLKGFQGFSGPIAFNKDGDSIKPFFVVLGKDGKWAPKVRGCSAPAGQSC